MYKNFKNRLADVFGGDSLKKAEGKTGIPSATLGRYTKGQTGPDLKNLIKIANAYNVRVGWLATGEEPKEIQNGAVVATISPGEERAKAKLLEQQNRATSKYINLRQIVEWMDECYADDEAQTIFLLEDMKELFPSFAEFLQKKRPGKDHISSPAQQSNRKTGS